MVRIDRTLLKQVSLNPTKNSRQWSIFDMCKKIDNQSLSLPLYQRDLSWTIAKCVALLNYQLLGPAPVSPISVNLINDTQRCVPQVSFIDREIIPVERGQNSVVDGQQRITTNYKAYINHEDFRDVVLDLGKGRFIEIQGAISDNQIPVGVLLYKDDALLFDYTQKNPRLDTRSVTNLLLQIKTKIKTYNYTINQAEDLSEQEQIEWFDVLNNAGSRVSIIQMRFSKLKIHGIDIYKQYTKPFRDKISDMGIDDLFVPQKTTTSYPIAALNPAYEVITGRVHSNNFAPISSDTQENKLCNLTADELERCFTLTLKSLDAALDFIEIAPVKKPDRIDYINYLIGFFVFNGTKMDKETEKYLVDWYNGVDFTNKSNSARRQIYKDLIGRKEIRF